MKISFSIAVSRANGFPLYIRRCLSGEGLESTALHIFVFSSPTVAETGTSGNVILLGTSAEGDSTWSMNFCRFAAECFEEDPLEEPGSSITINKSAVWLFTKLDFLRLRHMWARLDTLKSANLLHWH